MRTLAHVAVRAVRVRRWRAELLPLRDLPVTIRRMVQTFFWLTVGRKKSQKIFTNSEECSIGVLREANKQSQHRSIAEVRCCDRARTTQRRRGRRRPAPPDLRSSRESG